MGLLSGKVVIITGSGRGIGRATAEVCSELGAKVVINDVDADVARETLEELRSKGREVVCYIGDVSLPDCAEDIVKLALDSFGKVDAIVNNAGITKDALLVRMTDEQWDDVMKTHLRGTFLCSRAVVKHMIQKGEGGSIINLTSPSGLRGNIGQANYSTAKAGILGFTRTLSKELARYNIRVNAVAPIAWTRLTQAIPEAVLKKRGEEFEKKLKAAKPENVAHLVAFLVSDESKEINGQVLGVFERDFHIWSHPKVIFMKTADKDGFTVENYVKLKEEIIRNTQKTEDRIG